MQEDYKGLVKPTIAIDFDDTIFDLQTGEMVANAKESIDELHNAGYNIVIFSCRTSKLFQSHPRYPFFLQQMIDFLRDNNIYYDRISLSDEGKVIAEFYIDDK